MKKVSDIRKELIYKYLNNDFVIDERGNKTIEIINAEFECDEEYIIRKPNYEYIKAEIDWYLKQSLNIYDLKIIPKIWKDVADKNGFINSNYGYLAFSDKNFNQYRNCLNTLLYSKSSRRAIMLYNRPSIHYEYNENGKNDFICCLYNQFFIRNNKLISIVNFRSNDAVYGYNNDYAWFSLIYNKMFYDLKEKYNDLEKSNIIWKANSLHVYEIHFKYLETLSKEIK